MNRTAFITHIIINIALIVIGAIILNQGLEAAIDIEVDRIVLGSALIGASVVMVAENAKEYFKVDGNP